MGSFGLDVSSNNDHPLAWAAIFNYLKGLGGGAQPFVIVKINQGTGYVNPYAMSDVNEARAAGFAVAGYLMSEGSQDPNAQEATYRRIAGNLPQTDDVELPDGLSAQAYAAATRTLIAANPMALVYLDQSEVAEGFPTGNGLWLAEYNNSPGQTTYPCMIHQYADQATIPGCSGQFDLNVWMGTDAQFSAFFQEGPAASSVVPLPAGFNAAFVGIASGPDNKGYYLAGADGGVFQYGDATFKGSAGGVHLNAPGVAVMSAAGGYAIICADGGVFPFGMSFEGSAGGVKLNKPVVGAAPTSSGKGYWLAASDGGVFQFGDAAFKGSTGGTHLNSPVVGIASTPGQGYYLVGSDGGVFNFGDATFHGSLGSTKLNAPIVGIASTPDGGGYWLVAADGGIFNFGDAGFFGSAGNVHLNRPIVGMARTPSGKGYWLLGDDGGVFCFGDATFEGAGK